MDALLDECPFATAYLDDISYGADTLEELAVKRKQILSLLHKRGLSIAKDKCVFDAEELLLLGFKISHGSVSPTDEYVSTLSDWKPPALIRGLRKFIGKCSHINRMFPLLATALRPLYPLILKNKVEVIWTPKALSAFKLCCKILKSPASFAPIDQSTVTVISDAGEEGFAASLFQHEKLIGTLSRKYRLRSMGQLSAPVREAFAVKETLLSMRSQIQNLPIVVKCDHKNFQQMFSKSEQATPLLTRIFLEMADFNITPVWVPRSHSEIVEVDAKGRFSDVYDSGYSSEESNFPKGSITPRRKNIVLKRMSYKDALLKNQ